MFCFAASDMARDKVPHELNIRYGGGQGQLLDIYGTDLPKGKLELSLETICITVLYYRQK